MSAIRRDIGLAETARVVDEIGLPSCPLTLAELMHEGLRPAPVIGKAVQIVEKDAELVAVVLQAVNAPLHGLPQKVATIREAIEAIGVSSCANLVAGLLLQRVLLSAGSPWILRFWDETSQLALIIAYLAREIGVARFDEAYAFGLFRHGAVPWMIKRFSGYQAAYDADHADAVASIIVREQSRFGIDHARASAILARGWRLPERLWRAIQLHHVRHVSPEGGAGTMASRMAAVGLLADCFENAHRNPEATPAWMLEEDFAKRALGIGSATLEALRPGVALLLHRP